jgi:hypothetical protein
MEVLEYHTTKYYNLVFFNLKKGVLSGGIAVLILKLRQVRCTRQPLHSRERLPFIIWT